MHFLRNRLIYLSLLHDGNYDEIVAAIRNRKIPSMEEADEAVKALKCNVLTRLDDDYPNYLREMEKAPLVLFYYGDISLIDDEHRNNNLGLVGTRKATEYGLTNTRRIVFEVANQCTIVSGLAKGIDAEAHQASLDAGTKTVAVLGSGIDHPYPDCNKDLYKDIIAKGGLVISEYPSLSEPNLLHFPIRNRLIVMFSKALLITEAFGFKTGTSSTARFANRYGVDIMCIPYPVDDVKSFCNHLINKGAQLVRNGHDILAYLGLEKNQINENAL